MKQSRRNLRMFFISIAVIAGNCMSAANADGVTNSNNSSSNSSTGLLGDLQASERTNITSLDICQKMPLYIPSICYGINAGVYWMFGSTAASWILGLCNQILAQQTIDTARRKKRGTNDYEQSLVYDLYNHHELFKRQSSSMHLPEEDLEVFYNAFFEHQGFSSARIRRDTEAVASAGSNNTTIAIKFNDLVGDAELAVYKFRITSLKVCLKMIEKVSGMCQHFLGITIANHMRDFGWLCFFVYPTSTSRSQCYATAKGLTRLCRAQMSNASQQELEDLVSINMTRPSLAKFFNQTAATTPKTPIETCKALAPSISTLCLLTPIASVIYGSALGTALTIGCTTITDGLKYLIPHKHSGNTSTTTATMNYTMPLQKSLNDLLSKANVSWLQQGGIEILKLNTSTASATSVHGSRSSGLLQKNTVVGGANIFKNAEQFFEQMFTDVKHAWEEFRGGAGYAALYGCNEMVKVVAPICKKLGGGSGWFEQLQWVCFVAQGYAMICVYLVKTFAAICRTELQCEPVLQPSNFSCSALTDGFYQDSSYPCASYFYSCSQGVKAVMQCTKGQDYIFDEQMQKCRKRIHRSSCQDQPVPCAPEAQSSTSLEPKHYPHISCDPSLPVPQNKSQFWTDFDAFFDQFNNKNKNRIKTSSIPANSPLNKAASIKAAQNQISFTVPLSNSNCTKKKNWFDQNKMIADPDRNCSTTYYRCDDDGVLAQKECDHIHQVFSTKKHRCVSRKETIDCRLPPCSADDPLRQDCDERLPTAPADYDRTNYNFNCTGKPYDVYANPYEKCCEYFYICSEDSARTGGSSKKMSCNALKSDPDTYIFDNSKKLCVQKPSSCYYSKPPCREQKKRRK